MIGFFDWDSMACCGFKLFFTQASGNAEVFPPVKALASFEYCNSQKMIDNN